MRERGRDAAVAVGVAVVCVVLWQRLWSGDQTLYLWDAGTYFHPMKDFLGRTVRAGEWPWWNPWIRNGLPFYANPQAGLFYPPSVLFYLLPAIPAFNANLILHSVLLATGFFAWLLRSGRSPVAAALGALLVAWGGYALSMTVYLNNLQALAWIGWTWWAWERWLERRHWRDLALAAGGFGLQFLAGEPQVAVVSGAVALLLAGVRDAAPAGFRSRWGTPALALAAVAVLAMLLTAVQLVPTVELFRHSQRSSGLGAAEALGWSLPPAQLYNLLVPRYFETPSGLFDFRRIPGVEQPWVFTSYLGVVTIVLAAAGLELRAPRTKLWLGLAALGAFLALGDHNPVVAGLAGALPGVRVFRFPEKLLLLTAVAVPVLAAAGLDGLRSGGATRGRARATSLGLAAAGALAWGVLALGGGDAILGEDPDRTTGVLDALRSGLLHAGLFALLAAAVVEAHRWLSFPVLAGSLGLLALVDLAAVNLQVAPVAPAALLAEPPAVLEGLPLDSLRSGSRIRSSPLGEPPGTAFTLAGIASGTHQYYQLRAMGGNLAMIHRVLAQDGAEPFRPRSDDAQDEILRQLPLERQVRYLRLLATRWLIERPLAGPGLEPERAIGELGLVRYRILDPLPRAYLVGTARVEPDSVAVLNRFLSGAEDPRRIAYVAAAPGLEGAGEPIEGEVRWLPGSNHSVRLEVDATRRALLVLTDGWYPGWTVTVDGDPAPLRRVNWHFRGVMLEPGRHRVRFEYRPRGIVPAAVVSALGLLILLGGVAAGGRRGA